MNTPLAVNTPKSAKLISFTNSNERKQAIQVFVRLRPFLPSEEIEETIEVDSHENKIVIKDSTQQMESTFDRAFDQTHTQKEIFAQFLPSFADILDGYNMTIFAYGQTGSGKTHTMFGADWEYLGTNTQSPEVHTGRQQTFFESIESDHNYAGIIPRAIYEVFRQIALKREANPDMQISVYVSFIQIYNEKIFDLLQDSQKPVALSIHENKDTGTYVEGLAEYQVAHYYDSLQLMKRGEKNRATRSTSMNAKSSRSHTIFQMQIERIDDSEYAKEKKTIKRSKINLCDLAGSEKINKNEIMAGAHFNELRSINLSLTTLGKVIHSLSSTQKLPVPYRESKLTRILQDSLSGNCQTFIVANIAPTQENIDETLSTLKFAERAQHITLKVKPNEINASDIEMIQKLQREINYLKDLLNMRKLGVNPFDVHSRLLKLQAENERLKKTHISLNEVEKIIQENRQMKIEISKIQSNSSQTRFAFGFDNPERDTTVRTLGDSKSTGELINVKENKSTNMGDIINNYSSNKEIELLPSFRHRTSNSDLIKITTGGLIQQNDPPVSLYSSPTMANNKSVFLSTARQLVRDSGPQTELPMRIRGKYNDFKMEKGFLEMSNEEQFRAEKRKKEKMKIMERLHDLDRLQQNNKDSLTQQLKRLQDFSYSSPKFVKVQEPKQQTGGSKGLFVNISSASTIKNSTSSTMKGNIFQSTSSRQILKQDQQMQAYHLGKFSQPKQSIQTKYNSPEKQLVTRVSHSLNKPSNISIEYEMKIKRLEKKFLSKR